MCFSFPSSWPKEVVTSSYFSSIKAICESDYFRNHSLQDKSDHMATITLLCKVALWMRSVEFQSSWNSHWNFNHHEIAIGSSVHPCQKFCPIAVLLPVFASVTCCPSLCISQLLMLSVWKVLLDSIWPNLHNKHLPKDHLGHAALPGFPVQTSSASPFSSHKPLFIAFFFFRHVFSPMLYSCCAQIWPSNYTVIPKAENVLECEIAVPRWNQGLPCIQSLAVILKLILRRGKGVRKKWKQFLCNNALDSKESNCIFPSPI